MIRGDRVRLRALDATDAPTMWRWYQDHEFSVLDGNPYPSSLSAIEAFIRTLASPAYPDVSLGVEDEAGALIGIMRLKRGSPEDRRADFGIALDRSYWNKGYGTDATRTLLRFAFKEMNLHRVALDVLESNEGARRVYEKCGFREEGCRRNARFRDGRWVDEILMGILADEFI